MKTSIGVTVISSKSGSPRIVMDAHEEGDKEAKAWTDGNWELYVVYAPRTLLWNYGTEVMARFLPDSRRRLKRERDEEWFIHGSGRDRWADAVDYAQAAARENPDLCMHVCAVVEGGDVLLLALMKGLDALRVTRDATQGSHWTDGWGNRHFEGSWYDSDIYRVRRMLLAAGKNRLASGGTV